MRIGLVCPYSLEVPGGVQMHVRDLAGWLERRGHEVDVLAPERTVPVRYNGSVARVAFGPHASARTRAWLAQGRHDVVHLHEPLAPSTSMLAAMHAHAPLVATFHSAADAPRLVAAASGVLRRALPRIRVRLAVSRHAAATVATLAGPPPEIVPNGVDTGSFEVPAGERSARTVVFLGRFSEPRKGLPVLGRALPALLDAVPDATVLVAGPGRAADARRVLPDDPRVHVLGELTPQEKTVLLAGADVYVAPNLGGESFGIILVEAMAAGACVVASDLPAFRDVLDDGRAGSLVPVGSPAALAAEVARLLQAPADRATLAAAGRRSASRYDWSRVGPLVETAYERAAAGTDAVARGGR